MAVVAGAEDCGRQMSGATVYDGLEYEGAIVDDELSKTPSTGVDGCDGS